MTTFKIIFSITLNWVNVNTQVNCKYTFAQYEQYYLKYPEVIAKLWVIRDNDMYPFTQNN